MSSLLRPTFSGCTSSIRRRSSALVRPIDLPLRPIHFVSSAEECAIEDDISESPTPSPATLSYFPEEGRKIVTPQRSDTSDTLVPLTPSPGSELTPPDERFNWRIASGYFAYFLCGYADGLMATVLPYLMEDFNITFMTGSLFYAAAAIGYITGTVILEKMNEQLGRASHSSTRSSWIPFYPSLSCRSESDMPTRYSSLQARHLAILVGAFFHGMFFVIMGTRGGFPAIFVAQMTVAFARAVLNGTLNEYFAIVPKHLSYSFSLWGFGSVIAPLICQALLARGVPWYKFYLGTLVGSALNFAFLAVTFRATPAEFAREKGQADLELQQSLSPSPTSTVQAGEAITSTAKAPNTLRRALSLRLMWVVCLLGGIYFASETVSQAFIVSFLREVRNGNPNAVGFVPCGFFVGIALGRLIWGFLTPKSVYMQHMYRVNDRRILGFQLTIEGYSSPHAFVAFGMQLLIWFVHSIPVDGTALAIVGLCYGPVWPATLNWANDMLPVEVRMVSMAILSCAATLGCGILPFIAGVILNTKGAHTLPYINTALTGVMVCYWVCLPIKKGTASQAAGKV
ncbi:hypothetical protein NMY22_g41 [Coprinellus aureogranulatus]|nr:hypothetical protein NMY22_g41 [Coprinellus aureogranulatus]